MMKKASQIHMFILALSMAYSPAKAVDWEMVREGACFIGIVAAIASIIWAAYAPDSLILDSTELADSQIKPIVNNNTEDQQDTQLSHASSDLINKEQQLLSPFKDVPSFTAISTGYTSDTLQKEQDAIREAQRELAAQQERFRRQQERAQREIRMAQIDLAIQQIAFKKELEKKELDELKRERRELELALRSI